MLKFAAGAMLLLTIGLVVFRDDPSLDNQSLPAGKMDPDTLIKTISHGDTVTIEDHLIPGRWTVVAFYADW